MAEVKLHETKAWIGTSCIICGESMELTPIEKTTLMYGYHIEARVCSKCRRAVMRMREQVDNNG